MNTGSENKLCSVPWVVVVATVGTRGEPGGKPLAGSVLKKPAPIRPTPTNPIRRGSQEEPPDRRNACRKPITKATTSDPVIRKFTFCIQPNSPIDSELTGMRKGL